MEPECVYLNPRAVLCCTECGQGKTLCTCTSPNDAAHARLTSPQGVFFRAAGEHPVTESHLFESLVSAVGTVGQDLVEHDNLRTPAPDVIYKNLVYIAALAAKLATEGTPEYSYPDE